MNRAELVATLELTSRALADSQLVPIFTCFCFGKTHVRAFNVHIGVVAPCKSPEQFAVHGNTLLGLLRASQSDDVSFKIGGENEITVKAGKSVFKLPWFPEEDFLFEEPAGAWSAHLGLNDEVLKGLQACLLTTARDYTAPAMMGVCVNSKDQAFYSCDGDSLTRFNLPVKVVGGDVAMMPNAFCETALKIVESVGFDKEGTSTLSLNKEWVKAALEGGYTLYGRLIENKTPLDHAGLIKDTLKAKPVYVPVPATLKQALVRARVIADAESAPTKLVVESGMLQLVTSTHMGVVRDTIPLPNHPDAKASVSAEKVQQAIGLGTEMAILENCTTYRCADELLQVVGNLEG